ncbi:PEP-CTERM sorting domain-containing protein [Haloferula sargassicola]|uniref:Ice-binding protein C-terminal domain-containing protein n=1 Tax=Haloferula sargassicola TaxID=490096 RepID=A0ABP9UIB3_9BACT
MKIPKPAALFAVTAIVASSAQGALTFPYTEDFSSGSEGMNMSPLSDSLAFNGFTYSVDGTGGVAIFDVAGFLAPSSLGNFDGLGVIGDWQWSGTTTHNVHTFSVSSDGNTTFALTSLDWATGNAGPPTLYTITGYNGLIEVARVENVDLMFAGTYGASTGSEIVATDIGPGDGSAYGLNLAFSGSDWGNIDRFEFTATGNDIVVALDNIEFSAAVPEPSAAILVLGAGALGLGFRRR